MPIFSRTEMDRRIDNLRREMERCQVDCVVVTSYAAFYYLSGAPIYPYGRPMALIVPLDAGPTIVESIIEKSHTESQSWITDIRFYWDYNPEPVYQNPRPPTASLFHHVRDVLEQRRVVTGRIGFEDATLPVMMYDALRSIAPQATLVGVSDLLERLRLVHSEEELHLIRAADVIADAGQETLLAELAPGKSACQLDAAVRTRMTDEVLRRYPGTPFEFVPMLGLGSSAKGAGHSLWSSWDGNDRVASGQLLTTGITVWLWGYDGNVERTIYVGKPTEEIRRAFDAMVEANERAIAIIRPGVRLADVDRLTKDVLASYGYGTRTGSGLGRGITSYEGNARERSMDVRLYADVVLESGMAFSLEPNLEVPGIGTFRHCNTIIVTRLRCDVDSRMPRGALWIDGS